MFFFPGTKGSNSKSRLRPLQITCHARLIQKVHPCMILNWWCYPPCNQFNSPPIPAISTDKIWVHRSSDQTSKDGLQGKLGKLPWAIPWVLPLCVVWQCCSKCARETLGVSVLQPYTMHKPQSLLTWSSKQGRLRRRCTTWSIDSFRITGQLGPWQVHELEFLRRIWDATTMRLWRSSIQI